MDDVFLFTKLPLSFEDIEAAAESHGYRTKASAEEIRIFVRGTITATYYPDGATESIVGPLPEYWVRYTMSWAKHTDTPLEPSNQAVINAFNPASEYTISFHGKTLDQLAGFLKPILAAYDGWVGLDLDWADDNGKPVNRFTAGNVSDMPSAYWKT